MQGVPLSPDNIAPPPPVKRIWSGWQTAGFGSLIALVFVFTQLIVAIAVLVNEYLADPNTDLVALSQNLMTDGTLIMAATIASAITGLAAIVLFIKIRRRISIYDYLGLKDISFRTIALLFGVTAGLVLLINGLSVLLNKDTGTNYISEAYINTPYPALFWIAVVIFAPAFEEAFFRGFLLTGFKESKLGPTGAIILTAFFWSILHIQYDFFGMASIFILGLVFGAVKLRTGSLWSSFVLHSAWNLVAMIGTVLAIKGF